MVFRERKDDFSFLFNAVKKAASSIEAISDYNPTTLIADNAPAIENGFTEIFAHENLKRVNCWAHAIRNVDNELTKIKNKIFQGQLRLDILDIQLSRNKKMFLKLTELFELKWLNKSNSVDNFLLYFRKNWVLNNNGWYEGYSIGDPSTSNAIESSHKYIKKDTNRSRKPAIKFIHSTGKELVEEWSNARNPILHLQGKEVSNPNCKHYAEKPIIETKDWTEALKWNSKHIPFIKAYSTKEIYCASEVLKNLTKTRCHIFIKKLLMRWY